VDDIATYYLYTGDLAFVQDEWPVITRELAYNASLVDARGLLTTDASDGLDWDFYDGPKSGEVTAYNVIYYETLQDAASLASALGLSDAAAAYRDQAAALATAINSDLLDPTTGLYEVSSSEPGTIAQDANSLAVLYGVAPPARVPGILSALRSDLWKTPYGPIAFNAAAGYRVSVSPFISSFEVEARLASGETKSALALLRRLWGHMDAAGRDNTSTDWEMVGLHGGPGFGRQTSLAHGWASGATAVLSAYVLGVRPTSPGYQTWLVQPHPGSLAWAEGNVPTPYGTIAVRWAQDCRSGRFALQARVPAGSCGSLSVPVPRWGSLVVVRVDSGGRSRQLFRPIKTARGTTHLSVRVAGGATFSVDVQPR
jgi:alpha-L-rhamnosidase